MIAPKPKRGKAISSDAASRMIDLYSQGYGMKAIAKMVIGRESAKNTVRGLLIREGITLRAVSETQDKATKQRRYAPRSVASKVKRKLKAKKINFLDFELWEPIKERIEEEKKDARKEAGIAGRADSDKVAQGRGYKSAYHERYSNDPAFRAVTIYKRRFQKIAIGVGHGSKRMTRMIGCSPSELRSWIESQWEDWMTWENIGVSKQGNWQIDHIVPCSWFNQEDERDAAICWHHMNIRPLCSIENNSRRNHPKAFGESALLRLASLPDCDVKRKLIQRVNDVLCGNCAQPLKPE